MLGLRLPGLFSCLFGAALQDFLQKLKVEVIYVVLGKSSFSAGTHDALVFFTAYCRQVLVSPLPQDSLYFGVEGKPANMVSIRRSNVVRKIDNVRKAAKQRTQMSTSQAAASMILSTILGLTSSSRPYRTCPIRLMFGSGCVRQLLHSSSF